MQINYALKINQFMVKLIRCPTKMKIWKDTCPVKEEILFPALCLVVTCRRLKTKENVKLLALKVIAAA